MEAPSITEESLPVIPTNWHGLDIRKTFDIIENPKKFCLHEVSLPYTCEGFSAFVLGIWVICDIGQNLTVSEEKVTNVKQLALSGWTVELDSSNQVTRATCSRKCWDRIYQFHVEGEIERKMDCPEIVLLGDMTLTGSAFIRDLHRKDLQSATKAVCIARKTHDLRGRAVPCLSIGGPSSQTPEVSAGVLGQCPTFPVRINLSSYFPLNPQAPTYLQYSPKKPEQWTKWFIPSLGISINSKGDVLISQGMIVLLDSRVLFSSKWECLQETDFEIPGIFKRTISNCEHILQVHGARQDIYEQGKTLFQGSTIHLRSKSFSDLEIVEGEMKSFFTAKKIDQFENIFPKS